MRSLHDNRYNKKRQLDREDALKRKIEDTFPLRRLKINTNPTIPEEREIYEVEKIFDHKFDNKNKYFFLVKWMKTERNSWKPKENFIDNKPIEDYWKNQKGKEPAVKRERGRPKKTNFKISDVVNVLAIYLSSLILPIGCIRGEENF
ncbi:unnamed protein product [Brachionus calyciflorus]|uniref:Chromo domain-containing protein n=1 Tax=Brachionus calyciflorus TaxID=104777 RepID=A0A814J268_9BILA|nr:unnamed protein product [Brachionus calyciflorus]